ncbi:kinase-like protein [Coccomyxa subellipsoidea C-169]|uniref:Kinase-like protein n=1 Tax=Coccomyxa subellipsoidea (strain C-169) TaxID=574566 RepID=I0YQ97_COCSC|nr:kinase-like protein [Coccomyxa subellipsoidea C-169]EIE20566.1 kinase-like protein [Coccomyxa subellipsoidea C-169]|eukprot:XP_005645110.1 kinase-like protein [Coccomyxa subellipsoidea C-169]
MEDFEMVDVLGGGHLTTVALCTCSISNMRVAIKMYHKDRMSPLNERQVAREIRLQMSLQHSNIIGLFAAFQDDEGVYLVQEIAEGGDLFAELGRAGGFLPEQRVATSIMRPFVSALAYMHSQGILHRDIKPENILMTSASEIKLADFGLALDLRHETPKSCVGTLDYMPPEGGGAVPNLVPSYGFPADIWATGILCYELLVGGSPFEADTKEETYDKIMQGDLWLPSHLSANAHDFWPLQALHLNPEERPTAAQLLRHQWLAG